ncbi:MAG: hypothetical protein LBH17_01010 [Oscillospiraceae bacterium]|jgi:hypothetical protein|nr:hypothetical protein [Oscillospiraceae bacterium]
MNRSIKEGEKTVLIVALLISAVLTARASGMFGDVIAAMTGALPAGSVASADAGGTVSAEAARPYLIVVTGADGTRATAAYDDDARDALYEKTGSIMNEALASATEPVKCAESEWRAALSSPGVMIEYYSEVPLALARGWLGAPAGGSRLSIRRLCLVFSDGPSSLYCEGSDGFYRAEAASLGGDKTVPAVYSGNIKYEFETDSDSAAPYMLLLSDDSPRRAASASNPLALDGVLPAVLSPLGIDARHSPGYTDADGSERYVTSAASASVSPDGLITYRRAVSAGGVADNAEMSEESFAVETAYRTVAAVGSYAGAARIYFTDVEAAGDSDSDSNSDSFVVSFDYYLSGARVFFPEREHAVSVTITDGEIAEMTFLFREYSFSGAVALLPERQALAACGGTFKLGYSDGGSGDASPFWYAEGDNGQ